MVVDAGQDMVDSFGKKDLNLDGNVINLAIVGSSRFYDFEIFENIIEDWVAVNGYPDLFPFLVNQGLPSFLLYQILHFPSLPSGPPFFEQP